MPFIIISSLAMACQTLVLRSSQSTSNVIFISHINWQVKTKIYVKEILVCLLLDFGYDQDFFFLPSLNNGKILLEKKKPMIFIN